jgi:hypothetical protein
MIAFLREVMNLCPENENVADAISQTLGWFRANAAPGRRRSGFSYARIARTAFDDIRELTAEGFSYAAICEAFETKGLLPEGSKPYSLSRAMRREGSRRQKRAAPVRGFAEKSAGKKLDTAISNSPKLEPVKQSFGTPVMEKEKADEKVKALTGSAEETALGKLTKHSDGSFDFDWKD